MSKKTTRLQWKQDGYLHFAHARYGMWMIEQRRGKFLVELVLASAHRDAPSQDMGTYRSLAAAKTGAQRDHQALEKLD